MILRFVVITAETEADVEVHSDQQAEILTVNAKPLHAWDATLLICSKWLKPTERMIDTMQRHLRDEVMTYLTKYDLERVAQEAEDVGKGLSVPAQSAEPGLADGDGVREAVRPAD